MILRRIKKKKLAVMMNNPKKLMERLRIHRDELKQATTLSMMEMKKKMLFI